MLLESFPCLNDPLTGEPIEQRVTAKAIIADVAAEHGVAPSELTGRSRKSAVYIPRRIAMRRIRRELGYSFPRIARIFNREAASVRWAVLESGGQEFSQEAANG